MARGNNPFMLSDYILRHERERWNEARAKEVMPGMTVKMLYAATCGTATMIEGEVVSVVEGRIEIKLNGGKIVPVKIDPDAAALIREEIPVSPTTSVFKYLSPTFGMYAEAMPQFLKGGAMDFTVVARVFKNCVGVIENYPIPQPDGTDKMLDWIERTTPEEKDKLIQYVNPGDVLEVAEWIIASGLSRGERKNLNGRSASG